MLLPILTYSNTVVYTPHYVFIIAVLCAVIRKPYLKGPEYKNPLFVNILLIIGFSTINFVLHYALGINRSEIFPYTALMLGSYLIATTLTDQDLKVIIYLIAIECFVAYAEFIFGVKTFFTGIDNYVEARDSELLYFRSVYGLSENSSGFSIKVLLAYLLTYFLKLEGNRSLILKIILLGGLLVSFNRTSFVVLIFFHGLQFASIFIKSVSQFMTLKIRRRLLYSLVLGVLLISTAIYFIASNFAVILNQLTRGTQEVELTGREVIWTKFLDFISNNLLLGNGSFKYYADYYGGPIHAHNSFLQVLATHGLVIFAFHLLLIFMNLRKENIIFVAPLLLYSLAQYGIFWGISMTDIIFFVFLLYKDPKHWKIDSESQIYAGQFAKL